MTRLRNLALGGLAALALTGAATAAFADEPGSFQNRLQGATIGLPLGAAPPPGLYTGLETAYLGMANFGHGGADTGNWATLTGGRVGLPAIAQAVPLLWSTGYTFLGASYSMAAVAAFYEYNNCNTATPNCDLVAGGGYVIANPTFTPINLSWNLGNGWFTSLAFNFMAPIGTRYAGTPNPDYWTLEPAFAVSYIANNWVATANIFYDFNTNSTGPCCLLGTNVAGNTWEHGDLLYGDFSAVYKFGKWSVGPVAYLEVQTTRDNVTGPGGAALCATFCGNFSNVALGGLVGYDFGPVDLQLWVTDVVEAANSPAGNGAIFVWSRLGFKLWSPESPKPLVAKN